MVDIVETPAAPAPFSAYAQATVLPPNCRTVHVSGVVGIRLDGSLPESAAGQHAQVWTNIEATLAAAGMGLSDIYEVFAIVRDAEGVPLYREARDQALGGHLTASTLIVAGLADPDWAVEIMVRAAQPA